jgi:hypothetical protein
MSRGARTKIGSDGSISKTPNIFVSAINREREEKSKAKVKLGKNLRGIGNVGNAAHCLPPSNAPIRLLATGLYVAATLGHLGTGNCISSKDDRDEKKTFADD